MILPTTCNDIEVVTPEELALLNKDAYESLLRKDWHLGAIVIGVSYINSKIYVFLRKGALVGDVMTFPTFVWDGQWTAPRWDDTAWAAFHHGLRG
jgi:hypothetical protein